MKMLMKIAIVVIVVVPAIATNGMGICAVRPSKVLIKVQHSLGV